MYVIRINRGEFCFCTEGIKKGTRIVVVTYVWTTTIKSLRVIVRSNRKSILLSVCNRFSFNIRFCAEPSAAVLNCIDSLRRSLSTIYAATPIRLCTSQRQCTFRKRKNRSTTKKSFASATMMCSEKIGRYDTSSPWWWTSKWRLRR